MTLLSDEDLRAEWARFMSDTSNTHETTGSLTKNDIWSLVNVLDVRIDAFLSGLHIPPIANLANLANLTDKQRLALVLNDIRRRVEVA